MAKTRGMTGVEAFQTHAEPWPPGLGGGGGGQPPSFCLTSGEGLAVSSFLGTVLTVQGFKGNKSKAARR